MDDLSTIRDETLALLKETAGNFEAAVRLYQEAIALAEASGAPVWQRVSGGESAEKPPVEIKFRSGLQHVLFAQHPEALRFRLPQRTR